MRDPISGVEVDEQTARSHGLCLDYEGCTYCFSTPDCQEQFRQNPGRYSGEGSC
ncbi:MAG: YHS domain-containing protein [Chloroflexota bacterium]